MLVVPDAWKSPSWTWMPRSRSARDVEDARAGEAGLNHGSEALPGA